MQIVQWEQNQALKVDVNDKTPIDYNGAGSSLWGRLLWLCGVLLTSVGLTQTRRILGFTCCESKYSTSKCHLIYIDML